MLAALNLETTVFAAALIFARLGAILMLLPGFGEPGIPPRIRLAFALAFALAIGPVIAPRLPEMPAEPAAMAGMIAIEAVIGCLLYTSPSPRDRQKSRMPSSA